MPKRDFIIFWILLLFFPKFSCPGQVWMEFGNKILFLFFVLSHLVFAKNNAGKSFFNFLNFFTLFFGIFLPGLSMNGIRDSNFFPSFSLYLIPLWPKIMSGRGFIIFRNFLIFFSEFSCPGWVWMEFGIKNFLLLFFCLSHSRFC